MKSRSSATLTRPAALKASHGVSTFDCGRIEIDGWLRERARKAADNDTARTFVVCRGSKRVVGYHALAAGAVSHLAASGALRRNSPDPVPVIILARLGVDRSEQGQGLGQDLLNDAKRRALQAARIIGARALVVHALDAEAAKFYEALGFGRLNAESERTLLVLMRELRDALP